MPRTRALDGPRRVEDSGPSTQTLRPDQDYIRTARAKGLHEWGVMFRHALNNALIPLVTLFALDFPYIFAGSLYVELIFAWPGMGRLYSTTRRCAAITR